MEKISANEFTNVANIYRNCLETKDGYLIGFLRIFSYNLDLVSMEKRRAKTSLLALSFQDDRGDFAYVSYPREIDLEKYNLYLKKKYESEIVSVGRKKILADMIKESSDLVLSGDNYEHQHFFKVWARLGNDKGRAEADLVQRMRDIQRRFEEADIKTEILKESEIIKLCNLFGNAQQASFEHVDDSYYIPIPNIR